MKGAEFKALVAAMPDDADVVIMKPGTDARGDNWTLVPVRGVSDWAGQIVVS